MSAPGMVLDAAKALQIDLHTSYLVGDRWRDIEAGNRLERAQGGEASRHQRRLRVGGQREFGLRPLEYQPG